MGGDRFAPARHSILGPAQPSFLSTTDPPPPREKSARGNIMYQGAMTRKIATINITGEDWSLEKYVTEYIAREIVAKIKCIRQIAAMLKIVVRTKSVLKEHFK